MHPFRKYFQEHRPALESTLEQMIRRESPTDRPELVNHLGEWIAGELEKLGGEVEWDRQKATGHNVIGRFGPRSGEPGILLIGHMDTVYPEGTLQQQPYRADENRICGPGVLDMKAGLAIMLHSVAALRDLDLQPSLPLTLIFNSDEETGSHGSQEVIHREGRRNRCALVYEPSQRMEYYSLRGQGSAWLRMEVTGKACHVLDPERADRNALLEAARLLLELEALNNDEKGTLVAPTRIHGSGPRNVLPEKVEIGARLRAYHKEQMEWLVEQLEAFQPHYPNTGVRVEITPGRRPFGPGPETERFFALLEETGREVGLPVERHPGYGSSDANTVAEVETPVVDCLGAVGAGAHSREETIDRNLFPLRAAMAAAFLARLVRPEKQL